MQNDQLVGLTNLHEVIDRYPLTISADNHVITAIILMDDQQNIKTVNPSESLESLPKDNSKQAANNYILVVDGRKLLGIFTRRDLLRLIALGKDLTTTTIAEVMTQQLITLKYSDVEDICKVASIFQAHDISHLPILDDSEQLVGIINQSRLWQNLDLVKIFAIAESYQKYLQESKNKSWQDDYTNQPKNTAEITTNHFLNKLITEKVAQETIIKKEPEHSIEELEVIEQECKFNSLHEDIIGGKLAKETCWESQVRLTLALETVKMGIWEKSLTTRKCIWSDSIGPLYGLPKGSSCPPHPEFLQLIYPEDRHICIQAVTKAIEEGKEFEIEYRVIWADESIHWLSCTGKVYYNQEGEPTKIIGTTRQISDYKEKEQKLSEQAALLNIATDAIFVRDFQTDISFWNQGAEKIYGWSQAEVLHKKIHDIFYSKISQQEEETALQSTIQVGTWQGELHKQTKSGEEIIVESRWTLMFDDNKQPISILIVDTDITDKKKLQEQFYRTQRLESIGTLAGGIAHDLNNILTPIVVASQLMKGKFAKNYDRHPQLLTTIENNARRGSDLVKQVLSFARGVKGERIIIQVKHLITEIIQVARETFSKSIEFRIHICDNLGTICGDSTQLHQVLMNLVVNARDAMPEGGLLTITAENIFVDQIHSRINVNAKEGYYVMITVTDTGMGMSSEILDRIFEPFFTTKEVGTGTGLGLSTVLGIIKSHNGFVTVSSQIGQGSTFKVFLPSVESSEVSSLESLEIATGKGELILLVDDEPQIRHVTKMMLENHNYQTLTASNGLEGIAIYGKHKDKISLVLMDMMMPEMDGVTTIYSLQKINPKVQVIVCSGLEKIEVLPQSSDLKVQAILSKPYTTYELLRNVKQVIRAC